MSLWNLNPFNRKVHVPSPAKDVKHVKPAEEVVYIKTLAQLRSFLKKISNPMYQFNKRGYEAPPSLTLNYFLWYITYTGLMHNKKYKIAAKPLSQILDFAHFNSKPEDAMYTRIRLGASEQGFEYYFTLIDNHNDNAVLTCGLKFEHADFRKTAANLTMDCSASKEKFYMAINGNKLKAEQAKMREYMYSYLAPPSSEAIEEMRVSDSDVTFTESFSSGEVTPGDTSIAAPKSERVRIEKREEIENALPMPKSVREQVFKVVPDTPAVANNNNASNVGGVVQLNQTLMDPELIEELNEDPVITSLLEPEKGESNVEIIHPNIIIEVEKEVLKAAVKDVVENHHKRKQLDESYDPSDDVLNLSVAKKLKREEVRYEARKRTGQLYTGPHSLKNRNTFDYRGQTHDAAGRQINPNRSFRNQDDDYLDYAFYGFIREYGTIVNEIMKLPLGYDYNSQRRGSNVNIKALHFRNTFTHVTGTKASGRMILFFSELPWTESSLLLGRTWKEVKTEDILQKSVTMYAGDLEELEAADVFYNPTIMSQYDFKNVILGQKFTVLYDYYVDLNTQAVKGLVGEDVESVDSIKTKWVKIDDLELPLFYEGEDKLPMRGMLGVLFMGDYFGGEIETNMTLRVFYNSN
jgi:hypothetical protein